MNNDDNDLLIPGFPVKFVYLDPDRNELKDQEFIAHCHFLPSVGDRIQLGAGPKIAYVKRIYHSFFQRDNKDKSDYFQLVTVVLTSHAPFPEHESHLQ